MRSNRTACIVQTFNFHILETTSTMKWNKKMDVSTRLQISKESKRKKKINIISRMHIIEMIPLDGMCLTIYNIHSHAMPCHTEMVCICGLFHFCYHNYIIQYRVIVFNLVNFIIYILIMNGFSRATELATPRGQTPMVYQYHLCIAVLRGPHIILCIIEK